MPAGLFKDLLGQRFGRLTVLERGPSNHGAQWVCRCDCGKTHLVMSKRLQEGSVRSCGCLKADLTRERNKSESVRDRMSDGMIRHWETSVKRANQKAARAKKLDVVFAKPADLSPEDRKDQPRKFSREALSDLEKAWR